MGASGGIPKVPVSPRTTNQKGFGFALGSCPSGKSFQTMTVPDGNDVLIKRSCY